MLDLILIVIIIALILVVIYQYKKRPKQVWVFIDGEPNEYFLEYNAYIDQRLAADFLRGKVFEKLNVSPQLSLLYYCKQLGITGIDASSTELILEVLKNETKDPSSLITLSGELGISMIPVSIL